MVISSMSAPIDILIQLNRVFKTFKIMNSVKSIEPITEKDEIEKFQTLKEQVFEVQETPRTRTDDPTTGTFYEVISQFAQASLLQLEGQFCISQTPCQRLAISVQTAMV